MKHHDKNEACELQHDLATPLGTALFLMDVLDECIQPGELEQVQPVPRMGQLQQAIDQAKASMQQRRRIQP